MDLSAIINRKKQESSGEDFKNTTPTRTVNTQNQHLSSDDKKKNALLERLTNSKAKDIIEKDIISVTSESISGGGINRNEVKKICESVLKDYVKNDNKALKSLYSDVFNTIVGLNMEVLIENIMLSEGFIDGVAEKLKEKLM